MQFLIPSYTNLQYKLFRVTNLILFILHQQICQLFGKGMKQPETTVLFGFLTMSSFCLGHTSTSINDFWNEPIILWIAIICFTFKVNYWLKIYLGSPFNFYSITHYNTLCGHAILWQWEFLNGINVTPLVPIVPMDK